MHTLLYHDMERQLFVWLLPDIDGDARTLPEHLREFDHTLTSTYTKRVVTSLNELVEKILLTDAELDDRVIETLKIALREDLSQSPAEKEWPIYFRGVCQSEGWFEYEFVRLEPSGQMVYCVPRDGIWLEMARLITDCRTEYAHQLGEWLRIDRRWAEEVTTSATV